MLFDLSVHDSVNKVEDDEGNDDNYVDGNDVTGDNSVDDA